MRPGSWTISVVSASVLVAHPVTQEFGRGGDGAALGPVRVERGGEAGDARVLGQRRQDPLLPGGVDGVSHGR